MGPLTVGGDSPVRIQSMTTPKTDDVPAVVEQILGLESAGCELVRVTVNNEESAHAQRGSSGDGQVDGSHHVRR